MTFYLIQFVPVPVRGERVNVAVVLWSSTEGRWFVLGPGPALDERLKSFRAREEACAQVTAFLTELAASPDFQSGMQLLTVTDPHYRVQEHRLSTRIEVTPGLQAAYQSLVA